ncbi:RING/FYVE/PHD zinc finger superfamily protein [Tasmannia lanceolata]|uniref:RING/FYVE/PHD zinc finger superfamily protein n=1 Tax=Tasmannia lanceolata TaxID=3420 RepID=UPI004063021A
MSNLFESSKKRKRRAKVYRFHSFADPGCPTNFSGPFRDNIRSFLQECSDMEDYKIKGMPIWCTLLVNENSGVVIPLYFIEESVKYSSRPFCEYCRCIGWSHHFVSKRRYHMIIPVDTEWDKPLGEKFFDLQNHLLHGLIHCNGFGHLLCINGFESGSKYIHGTEIMDLWDRICTMLRTWEVTVVDVSRKRSMQLRLLYGVAYGQSWFGRWGYKFCHGSYGVTEQKYIKAIHILSSFDLDSVIEDFSRINREKELMRIVCGYRNISKTKIETVRDLLRFMLELRMRLPFQQNASVPTAPTSKSLSGPGPKKMQHKSKAQDKMKQYKDFASLTADMSSRWSARRLELAAQVIVDALKEKKADGGGGMSRQDVRDEARLHIGDTGLLDFVLKSIGNCIVGNHVILRAVNPSTRILEFTIEEVSNRTNSEQSQKPEPMAVVPVVPTQRADVYRDMMYVYKDVLEDYPVTLMEMVPMAARVILDSKNFVKSWPFRDDEDEKLRFLCRVMPSAGTELEELSRPLPPPELLVMPPHATVGELKFVAEQAMRDTYCIMEGFTAWEVDGVEGGDDELLFGVAESGMHIWLRGSGVDLESRLRYEGGVDNWTVDCTCGARDDDGERMVSCDICEVWQHTRCGGIDDEDTVPPLFLCVQCGSMLMPPGTEMVLHAEEYA